MYQYLCNQGFCDEDPVKPGYYCARHSTPGWVFYRRYRQWVVKSLVALITLPLLLTAMVAAWRFFAWVIVQ